VSIESRVDEESVDSTAARDASCEVINFNLSVDVQASAYGPNLFERYLDTVLIPSIVGNRKMKGCDRKIVILFFDNLGTHCGESILKKQARLQMLVITFPLHISHIFQVVDCLLFGRWKSAKEWPMRSDEDSVRVDHVRRRFKA
jgi:hypothetical protein